MPSRLTALAAKATPSMSAEAFATRADRCGLEGSRLPPDLRPRCPHELRSCETSHPSSCFACPCFAGTLLARLRQRCRRIWGLDSVAALVFCDPGQTVGRVGELVDPGFVAGCTPRWAARVRVRRYT